MPESPDYSEYRESDNTHFQYLGKILETLETSGLENLPEMPDKEVLGGIEYHLEPRILKHYQQTYMITVAGLDRASLIMQGILLEMLLKEYYYAVTGETGGN